MPSLETARAKTSRRRTQPLTTSPESSAAAAAAVIVSPRKLPEPATAGLAVLGPAQPRAAHGQPGAGRVDDALVAGDPACRQTGRSRPERAPDTLTAGSRVGAAGQLAKSPENPHRERTRRWLRTLNARSAAGGLAPVHHGARG